MTDVYEFGQGDFSVSLTRATEGGPQSGTVEVELTSRLDRHDNVKLKVEPGEGVDGSWFTIDPERHYLQTDDTMQAKVTVEVPADTVPASDPERDFSFRVGAYAETNQQVDFTLSQEYTFTVGPAEKGRGLPWWILAAVAAGVLVVAGLTVWLLIGGDDEFAVASYIGGTAAEAEAAFDGTVEVYAASGSSGSADSCVLLQAPGSGATAAHVALYTVDCPTPSPRPVLPTLQEDLCAKTPGFCAAAEASFTLAEWPAAKELMEDQFRLMFTIDGVETPNVVGLPLIEARAALQAADLDWDEVDDGSGDPPCRNEDDQNLGKPVLLQHPFATVMSGTGATVTLVLTACPGVVGRPDQVQIDSLLDTGEFSNLAAAVPGYARALRDDPSLGSDYLESDAMPEHLSAMVELFRYSFALAQVPDATGSRLVEGRTLMESAGLTVETSLRSSDTAPPCDVIWLCFDYIQVSTVVDQSLEPGLRIADLPDDQVVTLIYDTKWVLEQNWVMADMPIEVLAELESVSGVEALDP